MKKRIFSVVAVVIVVMFFVFLHIESSPVSVVSSSVFSTLDQTEIQLYVLLNTMRDVDEEKMAEDIILDHQKANGFQNNTVYTLKLYRTLFHYRRNWEYDTIICDENGAIICCKEDLGV